MKYKVGQKLYLTRNTDLGLIKIKGKPCTIIRINPYLEKFCYEVDIKYTGIILKQFVPEDMLTDIKPTIWQRIKNYFTPTK